MADTPKGGTKRKQQKQTLSSAGATPLVDKDGNDSIIVSDSPPESQEVKRRQKQLELDLDREAAGCDPTGGQVSSNMAPNQNKLANVGNVNDQNGVTTPDVTSSDQTSVAGGGESTSVPPKVKGGRGTKQVVEDITKNAVEELLGTEPSRPKRGRPRRRGLSVDPGTKPGPDDMMTVLLGIRQDNAVLKQDLVKTLDTKMSQFKYELDRDMGKINEQVTQHSISIEGISTSLRADKEELKDLDIKIQSIEDEVCNVRKCNQKELSSVADQISNAENSLAQDIETVKGHIESKFEETKQHQMLAEDRLNDITVNIEKENASFRIELEDLRATIERLQQPSVSDRSSPSPSDAVADSRPISRISDSDRTSHWSGSGGSFRSFNSNPTSTQCERPETHEGLNRSSNIDRSIILSNIKEHHGESLKLMVLDCVNDIGLNLKPEDIEMVYRIGDESEKRAWPRPVKCVLYDPLRRDQILYFKSRLCHSPVFKDVRINKEEHRELRIKNAMLRHAALIARREGRYVYQKEDHVVIDGTSYTHENIDDIPSRYRRNPDIDQDMTMPKKARACNVKIVGPSIQKLDYGLGFFSSNCFLSNFFECDIVCRNVPYRTLEHGYQARKAEICRDRHAYHNIMRARFPSDAKRAGGRIVETAEWDKQKLNVMEELLFCKFRQNKTLYYQLLNTRPHDLFECTMCEFWGTGCILGSIMMEERSWTGANHLGRMLVHIRSVLAGELVEGHDTEVKV